MPDHSKYITTPEFKKSTAESFTARLAKTKLVTKSDIANLVKKALMKNKEILIKKLL